MTAKISSISCSIFGCIGRPYDETMFCFFCFFCFRSFEQALVFWGGSLKGGRMLALVLCFAKYGVVKDSVSATFDESLTHAQREMRRMIA